MKSKSILISSLCLCFAPLCQASISFQLEADVLKTDTGTALTQSSLFLLVSSTTNSTFDAILEGSSTAVGSLLNLDDRILFRGDLSGAPDAAGVLAVATGGLVLNSGTLTNWTSGDPLALLWFPSLTAGSTTIPAGTKYGLYTNSGAVDGSDAWITPSDGVTDHNLLFYTQDGTEYSPGASASNAAAAGNATFTVGGVVPEPSRMMLGLFGIVGLAFRRRR